MQRNMKMALVLRAAPPSAFIEMVSRIAGGRSRPNTCRVKHHHDRALRCVLVLLAVSFGCSQRVAPVSEAPPPEVTVNQPTEREFAESVEFTGRTRAVEDVEIRARVSGHLLSVDFTEGEEVEKDQVLFQIDPRPFQATLEAAVAEVARVEAALAKATADLARNQQLRDNDAITEQQLDAAIAQEGVASASVDGAKAEVTRAQLDLDFATILAPVSGRVSRAFVTKGNLISTGAAGAEPLTTIVSVDPMHVFFDVDERSLLRIQKENREQRKKEGGDLNPKLADVKWPVNIGLANEVGFPHKGVLDFVDNRVDANTGTIRVRARFDNQARYLIPGLFVRVQLPTSEPRNHVLIPDRAVGTDLGQKYLMVVDEKNVAQYRNVTLGVRTPDGLRIVEKGLSPGESIIVDGLQRARPGVTVDPHTARAADDPKSSGSEEPG